MARPAHILTASSILERQGPLRNHLARVRSDDMDPQDPIRLGITDELDHTVRLEVGFCPAIRAEGKGADFVFDPGLLQLGFILSNPGDFWMGVHDAGDGVVVDMAVAFGDVFDAGDCFFFGFVGEHGAEGAVADDADMGEFGAVLFVDDEAAFVVDFKTDVFEAETGGVGSTTDGDEDDVCVKLFGGSCE